MPKSQALNLARKSADLVLRDYVKNLESKNAKLQKQIAKLECASTSYKHKVAALQKELSAYLKKGHITVQTVNYGRASDK